MFIRIPNYDDFANFPSHVPVHHISDPEPAGTMSTAQIFVVLVIAFMVIFMCILCCASPGFRRKIQRPASVTPPPVRYQPPNVQMCPSCHTTVNSMSQLDMSNDPSPPSYDSIYSTTQSTAILLNHSNNRRSSSGPAPSAPPIQ